MCNWKSTIISVLIESNEATCDSLWLTKSVIHSSLVESNGWLSLLVICSLNLLCRRSLFQVIQGLLGLVNWHFNELIRNRSIFDSRLSWPYLLSWTYIFTWFECIDNWSFLVNRIHPYSLDYCRLNISFHSLCILSWLVSLLFHIKCFVMIFFRKFVIWLIFQ